MPKISQEQIHGLLFSDKLSWQSIIYDLINTEQLDPWDIDISLLAQKFLRRVHTLEEANFFISSKVLLAAALLLRIKSEILLEQDLQSLDDILSGKKEKKQIGQQTLEFDEEIPELMVRTPLPRYKKVTLEELMQALGKAISTENRRIKRVILDKQHEFETALVLPKHRINLHDSMKDVHKKLKEIFETKKEKIAFSDFAGNTSEQRISTFIPLLHLDTQHKIWLEQKGHCEEIWILLKHLYEQQKSQEMQVSREEDPGLEFQETYEDEEDEESGIHSKNSEKSDEED